MGVHGAAGVRRVVDAPDAHVFVFQFHLIYVRHGQRRVRDRRARLGAHQCDVRRRAGAESKRQQSQRSKSHGAIVERCRGARSPSRNRSDFAAPRTRPDVSLVEPVAARRQTRSARNPSAPAAVLDQPAIRVGTDHIRVTRGRRAQRRDRRPVASLRLSCDRDGVPSTALLREPSDRPSALRPPSCAFVAL